MQGIGRLLIYDYAAFLQGTGSLIVGLGQPASATMSGTGTLYANGRSEYGYAMLPRLSAFGGEVPATYGYGSSSLPALVGEGSGGFYIPTLPVVGYGYLPALIGSGVVVTTSPGSGNAELPPLLGKGGEGHYGEGSGTLPAMVGFGCDDAYPGELRLYSSAYLLEGSSTHQDHIILFTSTGQLVDTISGSRELIATLLEELTAQGSFTVLGDFIASAISTGIFSGSAYAAVGTRPSLDDLGRVWVVNLDTGASSQYDGYGFNSFFERDGEYYGVADDGIYKLDGDTDNGEEIDALIDFGKTNFNSAFDKRILRVWAGVSSEGLMILKIGVDGNTYYYAAESYSEDLSSHRFKIGREPRGNYFNLTLMNQDGNDFDLESMNFEPVILSRK